MVAWKAAAVGVGLGKAEKEGVGTSGNEVGLLYGVKGTVELG